MLDRSATDEDLRNLPALVVVVGKRPKPPEPKPLKLSPKGEKK